MEKSISICFNDVLLYDFKTQYVKCENGEYFYDGNMVINHNETYHPVRMNIERSYDVFDILQDFWGGWNEVPSAMAMRAIARHWEEKYDFELISVSHDQLGFQCKRVLTEQEIELLLNEIISVAPNTVDIYKGKENVKKSFTEKGSIVLWWD